MNQHQVFRCIQCTKLIQVLHALSGIAKKSSPPALPEVSRGNKFVQTKPCPLK